MASTTLSTLRPNLLRGSRAISQKRLLSTTPKTENASSSQSSSSSSSNEPLTHYRITQTRSAISLPKHIKGTLVSLGLHRRLQTVYHPHNQINAGKILMVKELVSVENVPAEEVRTKTEIRQERKAPRGYVVSGSKLEESP
ncbi:hypothetical protein QCA50_018436 [Cerrena zonata]|uniref:Large ribosomal subunit protein uL30m n=1 Tax=Cerrena zonata TaxID=2478898 RepID=A0AAW0FK60_9APHY